MATFQLEVGEQIILESEQVSWIRDNDIDLEELALSNKYLYIVYKKKNGIFLKSTIETIKRPLSDIVIRNGQVMVTKENISRGPCLQIQFIQGKEQFYFYNSARKNITNWINEIYIVLVGVAPSPPQKKTSRLRSLFGQKESNYTNSSSPNVNYVQISNDTPSSSPPKNDEYIYHSVEPTRNADTTAHEDSNKYCSRCGEKLDPGDRFCPICGTPVSKDDTYTKTSSSYTDRSTQNGESDRSKRKQEYAGTVVKCPACGAEIQSFTAICPVCGHEINSAKVSSAIQEFSMLIGKADEAIANSPTAPKKGWNSWNGWAKVGWVILNIYTFCIPLVLYYVLPFLGVGGLSSLTPEEKKKAQLISNYAFPNDRENILEALSFIKVQMESLASGKIDKNVFRWMGIWKSRASQLYEKAEHMFKGDTLANNTYSDILLCEQKANRALRLKAIIATIIVCVFAVVFVVFRGKEVVRKVEQTAERREQRAAERAAEQAAREEEEEREANATFVWPTDGIALHIPEPASNKGEIKRNTSEEFDFEIRGTDQNQYETYKSACIEAGYTVDADSTTTRYEAYNEEGYKIYIVFYTSMSEIDIDVSAPMAMNEIQWPASEIAKRLPVPQSSLGKINWERASGFSIYLGNTTQDQFRQYADSCFDMGFTVDYEKGDTFFRGYDKDGYYVSVEYRGFNIICIRIDEPDQ